MQRLSRKLLAIVPDSGNRNGFLILLSCIGQNVISSSNLRNLYASSFTSTDRQYLSRLFFLPQLIPYLFIFISFKFLYKISGND